MTKEEYLKAVEHSNSVIKKAKEEENEAKRKYIEQNTIYKIGDKVSVESRSGLNNIEAFVYGFKLDYSNDIEVLLKKVKKDGTQSTHDLHSWYYKKGTINKI